jgi:hypothetical protein
MQFTTGINALLAYTAHTFSSKSLAYTANALTKCYRTRARCSTWLPFNYTAHILKIQNAKTSNKSFLFKFVSHRQLKGKKDYRIWCLRPFKGTGSPDGLCHGGHVWIDEGLKEGRGCFLLFILYFLGGPLIFHCNKRISSS